MPLKRFLFVLSLFALASCQKQEAIRPNEEPSTESQTISLNDALENLQNLRSELFPETKSSLDDILSVEVFGKCQTKSSISFVPDTLLYLVNLKEVALPSLLDKRSLHLQYFASRTKEHFLQIKWKKL